MIKKIVAILLVFLCAFPVPAVTIKAESAYIENDETGIPDGELYRSILSTLKKKKDEKFTKKEAARITHLSVLYDKIKTFQGLGCLNNLKELNAFGIHDGNLKEIAGELPNLQKLTICGYDEEYWERRKDELVFVIPEERKNKLNSLDSLKNMKNLVFLDVSDNNLTSLKGIDLGKIKTFHAANNQLVNLNGIKNLKNLIHFDVSNNNLTSVEGIEKLKKLKKINLSGNHLTGLKGIEKLKNLEELYLDYNDLEKIGEASKLKNLKTLYMNGNHLTEVKGIKNLKNLKCLWLNQNELTKVGEIKRLKNLKSLSLSGNQIKTLSDSDLKNLKKLTYLNLYENELKKLPGKKSMEKLKIVYFSWNYLTKKEIKKKLKKRLWEGHSLCRWMWQEQKTDIRIAYLSPDQKLNITKDTKEIVAKVTPAKLETCTPHFYLLLPDGKTAGWDGENYNAAAADTNGVFRIEGLDLREYAGKEAKLMLMLDYEWKIIIDRFVIQG